MLDDRLSLVKGPEHTHEYIATVEVTSVKQMQIKFYGKEDDLGYLLNNPAIAIAFDSPPGKFEKGVGDVSTRYKVKEI